MNNLYTIFKGEKKSFHFKTDKELKDYITVCENIWGCIPLEISWSTQTDIYKKGYEKHIICSSRMKNFSD